MLYLIILGLVVSGFLLTLGITELVRAERAKREREALREAARLAHDTQADELNRSMNWRD
jgi:hypothetical protein